MKKIHSTVKKRFGLSTHLRHNPFSHREKSKKPKTFKTEEYAHIYASTHSLTKEQYYLKKTKHNKRFEIVLKDL